MKKVLSLLGLCLASCGWGATVARIGSQTYDSLTAACAAAKDGDLVELLADVKENTPTTYTACTVDFGGHTLDGCIRSQYNTAGGVNTFKNGTATSGFDGNGGTADTYPNGALVFENFNMNATFWTDGHPVTVRGGTYRGDIRLGQRTMTIEDGTFLANFVFDHADGRAVYAGGRFKYDCRVRGALATGCRMVVDAANATTPYAVVPATVWRARWTGAAGDGDLANAANWTCIDRFDQTVADAVPDAAGATLCLSGDTSFSFPADGTPRWHDVAFRPVTGAPVDKFGYFKRNAITQGFAYDSKKKTWSWSNLGMVDSAFADFPLGYLTYVGDIAFPGDLDNTNWKNSYLGTATARIEGWFYVTEQQAGTWICSAGSDDYVSFAVDGNLLVACLTYTGWATGGRYQVGAGWHRYTVAAGDTWGGYGAPNPVKIAINGGEQILFNESTFTFGGAANTVRLTADCDWRGLGTLEFPAGFSLDLNGHNLAIRGAKGTMRGGATIAGAGHVTVDGGTFDDTGITVAQAALTFTNSVVAAATWTGAGATDSVNDPANWSCTDADGHLVAGGVPGDAAAVSFDGAATTLQIPAGQTLATAFLQPSTETLTLAADCDWRGGFTSAQLPADFDGARIPYLDAPKGSFVDTGFKPNGNTRVAMDVTVQSACEYWFGAWNASSWEDLAFCLNNDGSGNTYLAYQYQNHAWGSPVPNGRHRVELDRNYYLLDGALMAHRLHASFQMSQPLYLFAQNRAGTARPQDNQGTIRFHEAWIYDNGALVRHYVPVRRADGTVGVFDLVNNAFSGNGGTGAFTGGVSALAAGGATFLPAVPVDLAGHALALAPVETASVLAVTDSGTGTPGELHLHVTSARTFATTDLTLSGNAKVVFETAGAAFATGTKLCGLTARPDGVTFALDAAGAAAGVSLVVSDYGVYYGADPDSREAITAHWTGAAGDGDPANGANWVATNLAGRAVAQPLLTAETSVFTHGYATIKVPATGFRLKNLVLDGASVLTLDASDWTGAAGDALVTTVLGITADPDVARRLRVVNPRLDVALAADGTTLCAVAKSTIAWRNQRIGADYSIHGGGAYRFRPLAGYATAAGPTNTIRHLTTGNGTAWQSVWLQKSANRLDGWFRVTDEQAGTWALTQYYDDYMAFAIDGDWKLVNPTYMVKYYATFEVAAGWHHFTIVCGDTAGGYGYYGSDSSALALKINGASAFVPFDARTFAFEDATACASGDLAVTAVGETPAVTCDVAADCRLVLDPAVTHLTLMRAPSFEKGAKIALAPKYAAAKAGSFRLMTWETGTLETFGAAPDDLFDVTSAQGAKPSVTVVTHADGSGELRLTLDTDLDPATAHWRGTEDGDFTKSANWLCANAAGETVAATPGWGTDVFIDAADCNLSVPAGAVFPHATLTLAPTVTLAADCDWSGLGGNLAWLVGKTVDVNGHALTLAPTYELTGGTVTNGTTGGTCRLVVGEGLYVVNTGLAIAGGLRFVKDGAGTYSAEKTNQSYTDGTFVAAGVATSPASGDGKYTWSPWQKLNYGPRKGTITVEKGAVFDTAGNHDYRGFHFVLAGGTLRNSGADMSEGWTGIGSITLTDDSVFDMLRTTVQNGAGDCPMTENSVPVMNLNGHTLDIRLAPGKYWKPAALIIRNGLVRVRDTNGGETAEAQMWNFGVISAETADLDFGCRLEFKNDATVRNFTCRWAEKWGWSETGKVVTVVGTFRPVSDYFCNVKLVDGSCLDLSTKTEPWSVVSADHGNDKTFYATFAEGATVRLDVGARKLANGTKLIAWEAAPAGVRFRPAAVPSVYTFGVRSDGVYVYTGFCIHVR